MIKTALVLVDIQNDYFPGGSNELHKSREAAARARSALETFRTGKLPVIHVRHISLQSGATFFLPGTEGAEIYAEVAPAAGEPVAIKHKPDSFLETELDGLLSAAGAECLVICGMMSHMCIDTTVRSAKARGYEVVVLHDACATKALRWEGKEIPAETVHAAFMSALSSTFAEVVASERLSEVLERGK